MAQIWFRKLLAIWIENDIKPHDIYNMDETSFCIGTRGKQCIITWNTHQRCMAACSTNREFVTVVECVSANKEVIPPLVILPGKKVMESWVINIDLLDDFSLATSDTGYSNDDLSLEWLKHFDRHSACRQEGEYCLLIMDGYGSHCTIEFIE